MSRVEIWDPRERAVKKFIILYKSDQSADDMMRNSTPEQRKAGMDMWMNWAKGAGSSIVELGNPLGSGRIVTKSGATAAPIGVAGYSIMQGESIEDVTSKLKGHPHFMTPGMSSIEVYEIMPVSM